MVKREFASVCSALIRLQKFVGELTGRINELQRVPGFRNRLAHDCEAESMMHLSGR